jgi:hypothetical protein
MIDDLKNLEFSQLAKTEKYLFSLDKQSISPLFFFGIT